MDCLISFLIILLCFASCLCIFQGQNASKLPPGPNPFHVIGNILELGAKPHQSLAKLAKIYGPLMHLKLGSLTTIVVSSPEMAKIVLQEHDRVFSNRIVIDAVHALDHHKYSMGWLSTGNLWRKLRKICKEQMFSIPSLDASEGLRREKLEKLCDYVRECCETGRTVDIADAAFTTTLNLISATLFSVELAKFNSNTSQDLKDVVWGIMKCWGKPNLADYFPILKLVDPQGIRRETKIYFLKLFDIFDRIIDDKLKFRGQTNDMVDALIDINQRDQSELSRDDIKHLLLLLFSAGTDTTGGTVEWAMAELLRNPDKMSRLRGEIKDLVGENCQIQESDISRLPYLNAVVKETFRLHPVAPLLVPHKADDDVEINGYIVPKNAQIIVNVWASGRDSSVWPNANSFVPERFLDKKYDQVDVKGKDFELIPFGAGRRICPGMPLANRMVPLMLANLVHEFSWKVEEIDMTEKFGITLHKAVPLIATPMKF